MNGLRLATLAGALLLTGCGDGVPRVVDPHNIVISGKAMTQRQFLDVYCAGKKESETCMVVGKAMIEDSTKSRRGPARF